MLADALSILVGAFLGAAAVAWVVSRGSGSGHECDLRPIAVDHRSLIMGPAQTVVLWRCPECGRVETTMVDGRFSLAQIQGASEDDEQEEVPDGRS